MSDLDNCRKDIDSIDKQLVELFEKRMDIAVKVVEYKEKNNLPILNETREKQVIEKNIGNLKNKDYSSLIREFFTNLMGLSRKLQSRFISHESVENINDSIDIIKARVGFQGVKGSFSQEALINYFGKNNEIKSYEEFEDVFLALRNNEIDYGVLPIENSYTGAITQVYDLLVKCGFYIVGEECIKIEHYLLGVKGANFGDIEEIYSHTQGFEQCRGFLNYYSQIKQIPYHNTAISAKLISDLNDKTKAAIASKRAAEIYGLDILRERINDKKDNCTKFIIIGKKLEVTKECNKVSVVFSLEDEAGTLYRLLGHFAENNINMLKIESRPNKHELWKYLLYVDFEGHLYDEKVKIALELIGKNSGYFKLLGSYKRAKL